MSTIKFEGEIPEEGSGQTYPVGDDGKITIEELMASIRNKIKRIQENNNNESD